MTNPNPTSTTTTNLGSDAGVSSTTGAPGNTGTTPPSLLDQTRSGLKPGDVGYDAANDPTAGGSVAGPSGAPERPLSEEKQTPLETSGARGTGSVPAASTSELSGLSAAPPAPGELGATHVTVPNDHVGLLRRLFSDFERGIDGAEERLKEAFHRIF